MYPARRFSLSQHSIIKPLLPLDFPVLCLLPRCGYYRCSLSMMQMSSHFESRNWSNFPSSVLVTATSHCHCSCPPVSLTDSFRVLHVLSLAFILDCVPLLLDPLPLILSRLLFFFPSCSCPVFALFRCLISYYCRALSRTTKESQLGNALVSQ